MPRQLEKPHAFDPRGRSCVDPRKRFYFDPPKSPGRWGHFYFALLACLGCIDFAYALTSKFYLMCRVHDAVKHSVCYCRVTDCIIPNIGYRGAFWAIFLRKYNTISTSCTYSFLSVFSICTL